MTLQICDFTRSAIARRIEVGILVAEPQARGIYRVAGRQLSPHHDLMVVSLYAPASCFCLLTALHLLQVRGPAPDIWLTVPAAGRVPDLPRLPLELVRPRAAPAEADTEVLVIDGVPLRHTSAARTVADCFQYRSRVGLDVALSTLRVVRRSGAATMDEIWGCAVAGGVGNLMLPYLESIT